MKNIPRILFFVAGLLLATTFFLPMWQIQLWAPQYPEGLSLYIWADKFTGDVQTVNILNHYIGMAKIEAEAFPELKMFPVAFGILLGAAFLVAIIGRRLFAYLWTAGVVGFASWSMLDFYNWEYKFGRNLNPDAAIKMDDMIYQPPLIGSQQFLNITASSWPSWAGFAFTASILVAFAALVIELKRKKA